MAPKLLGWTMLSNPMSPENLILHDAYSREVGPQQRSMGASAPSSRRGDTMGPPTDLLVS